MLNKFPTPKSTKTLNKFKSPPANRDRNQYSYK